MSTTSSCSTSTALSTPPDPETTKGEGATTISLDVDEVTQEMAARLTIALVGQILYMKGQVPFPIASLTRMMDRQATKNASRTAKRAEKRRMEFLQSYDDLTSHLRTTFVALSTSLAKNENEYPISFISTSAPSTTERTAINDFHKARRHPAKIYILLVLGPSPSAAKARYLLEIDGFRVEQFGEWEYSHCGRDYATQEECSSENEDKLVGLSEFPSPAQKPIRPTTPQRPPSEYFHEGDSPCSSASRSDPASVPSSPSELSVSDDGEPSASPTGSPEEPSPFTLKQRAEEALLHTGERLLYRALFAGDEGFAFGDEIPPTQSHVFIRAPRRFTHPTWVPRQSLGSMLDSQVQRFLELEFCLDGTKTNRPRHHPGFGLGVRTMGVRVTCQGQKKGVAVTPSDTIDSSNKEPEEEEDEKESEEDELIWWSWDGKLVGFTE